MDSLCEFYACTAQCEHGGRCRQISNPADPDWLCGTHAKIRNSGGQVSQVGLTDVTLVRFKLGPDASYWAANWPVKFLKAGIMHVSPEQTLAEREEEIRQRGEQTGRKVEGVYGQGRLDDGCAIFGPKGLANVRMHVIVDQLVGTYGGIAALQLIEGKVGNPILELVFSKTAPKIELPAERIAVVHNYLSSASFGWVAAFHNPRHPTKGVVMTINTDRRQNDDHCKELALLGGRLGLSA